MFSHFDLENDSGFKIQLTRLHRWSRCWCCECCSRCCCCCWCCSVDIRSYADGDGSFMAPRKRSQREDSGLNLV